MSALPTAPRFSAEIGRHAVFDYLRACGEADCQIRATVLDNPSTERLVIACDAVAPAGSRRPVRRFIAKVFGDDTGARSFAAMNAIERAFARHCMPAPTLAMPRALWYDAALRCLVQERVDAEPFPALPQPEAFADALQAAGVALAELHALHVPALPTCDFDQHVADLVRPHPETLARQRPELAASLRVVLDGCRAATGRPDGYLPATLHRDFHPRQLFHGRSRIWVIDWDLAAAGDPALDIGNFLMLLELKYGTESRPMAEAFLAGYAIRSDGWPALRARLPGWQATACLRRACKAVRLAGDAGCGEARRLLNHAVKLLAGLGGGGR